MLRLRRQYDVKELCTCILFSVTLSCSVQKINQPSEETAQQRTTSRKEGGGHLCGVATDIFVSTCCPACQLFLLRAMSTQCAFQEHTLPTRVACFHITCLVYFYAAFFSSSRKITPLKGMLYPTAMAMR